MVASDRAVINQSIYLVAIGSWSDGYAAFSQIYHRLGMGLTTMDRRDSIQFQNLWSTPMHNIKPNTKYPAILVTNRPWRQGSSAPRSSTLPPCRKKIPTRRILHLSEFKPVQAMVLEHQHPWSLTSTPTFTLLYFTTWGYPSSSFMNEYFFNHGGWATAYPPFILLYNNGKFRNIKTIIVDELLNRIC